MLNIFLFYFFTEKTPKIIEEVTENLQCVVVLLFLGVNGAEGGGVSLLRYTRPSIWICGH